ncbi:GFA family protein [Vibrio penaeicida]|uniref:GFA family protein n=1 Tax=Vibrio penaeicida TaxID=104609 RepID=UPI00273343F8|nr:GFA family protein [Vibrio penaeicida]MDP2571989.1 GFA family protein [Vibrio penaeicida]
MYKGSCLCGSVELSIQGKITDIIHCHCSLCRKSSGTAFATNGFVNTSDFEITKGKELLSFFEVKPGKKRHFCKQCASPIYSSNDENPSQIRIRLGILDSDIEEKPISHNFVTSKANWDSLNEELPHYERHEPSRSK